MDDFESRIRDERIRQDIKWGEQNHRPDYWLVILGEEFGELCNAVLEDRPRTVLHIELTHIAAVCKAIYECSQRNNW